MQKALIVKEPKVPFTLVDVPIPKPGPGELLVKVLACALNPVDHAIQLMDILPGTTYPAVLGFDIAGDIVEVGEGVEGWVKGDRVFFPANGYNYGGFQQYTLASVDAIGKIPAHMSYAEASSIPLTFTTAAIPLMSVNPIGAGLNPTFDSKVNFNGEAALVIGGGSSVGQFGMYMSFFLLISHIVLVFLAIQILKYVGYSTIITYASAKHTEFLKSIGATHVVDRAEVPIDKLPEAVKSITSSPNGIKTIYLAVLRDDEVFKMAYTCLAPGGQMATALPPLMLESEKAKLPANDGRKLYGVWASTRVEPNIAYGKGMWKNLPVLMEERVIKPNRVEILPGGLAAVADALPKFFQDGVSGVKLVVNPQDTA
ncbi:chaperonin 10-like protein [Rhodocollybia butyracea]|uniref:Chaperonin 10-like protein n=1 Tax=Rhodocollybia butyracea TaxID=206335 RepID=A0A9P5U3M1_9AGAR|nr:chaperonin 10-like protein [Rhodocollybia butyracea]